MKLWKCPFCDLEKFSGKEIIIKICPACIESMKEVKDEKKVRM